MAIDRSGSDEATDGAPTGIGTMGLTRRELVAGAFATTAAMALGLGPAFAQSNASKWFNGTTEDNGVVFRATKFQVIKPQWKRQIVQYYSTEPQGTVVIDTRHHFLYVIFENNTALRYGVGVGKEGFKWYGTAQVDRKAIWPTWTPPPEMLLRRPDLPRFMEGGADNPLGPRAPLSLPERLRPRLPRARHHRAVEHRLGRLERLHPHVQRGRHRPLPARADRHEGAGAAAHRREGDLIDRR
jgi:hypothetical protein